MDSLYDSPFQFQVNRRNFGYKNWVVYVYFGHYIFNDFVILATNLAIDIKLVIVIRQDIKKKMEFLALDSELAQKMMKKRKSIHSKINSMLVINILIYVICRLTELLAYVFFYLYEPSSDQMTGTKNCDFVILCYLIANSVEYVYMTAYTFNILIYYKFNTNFRRGFHNFFKFKANQRPTEEWFWGERYLFEALSMGLFILNE